MNSTKLLIGVVLTVSTFNVLAAVPVVDITSDPSALSTRLNVLERKLDARNKSQISIQNQLDDLQDEVNQLRGVTELHTHQLSQVIERQRELYQELDRRVSEALKPKVNIPATIQAPAIKNTDGANSYSDNLNENESYDRAVNLVLKDKRYQQAIVEFKSFNSKYPNSSYAPNSHYWLGQLLFTKGDLTEAAQEFKIVVSRFKDSSKRSDAMLKLAVVAQKQKNKAKAIVLYKQVIKEYSSLSVAQLAKARLELLNNNQ